MSEQLPHPYETEIDTLRAQVRTLEATLASRHGGEPVALLRELDKARAEVERLKREREVREQSHVDELRNEATRADRAEREVERLRAQLGGLTGPEHVPMASATQALRDVATRQCRAVAAALKKNGLHGFAVETALATPLVTDAPGTIAEAVARHPDIVAAEPVLGVMAVPGPRVGRPAPTLGPDSAPVWPEVLRRAPKWLHPHLEARRALGLKRYGVELHTHNGRNMARDAAEELLDAVMYLAGARMEDGDMFFWVNALPHVFDALGELRAAGVLS